MQTQEAKRQKLFSLLGDLPNRNEQISVKRIKELDKGDYILEVLLLDKSGSEMIPAYFARPKETGEKMPVVLFNHSHGGNYVLGKTELIQSSVYLQQPSYAEQLTSMGYGVLCIDMIGFGERRGKAESEIFKEMLWRGQVMWGRMVFDNIRALDYLLTREDVDSSRIATLGMSMGGLMAWWLSALDQRIKVCVDITAQVDAETLIENHGLDSHGFYSYVPSLLKYFSTSDIQKLIVPRHHLSAVGIHDKLTPLAGLNIIDKELTEEYTRVGVPERWKMVRNDCGHIETACMRAEVCEFLQKNL
ncbi:dienelactone hydrolase family protein [Litchfieldia salsa]|uniref:Acetyl xylan esterase (AXE1) n=1 Tax=Litchfieldia salsa TaxID=930152 RepID=A0A1H0VXC4_9BACI|nr:alpha/beta fold hydrolase [Litchfieldia salsa]SDP83189.1 Acetyl xylan esterase (AXE1) [Litchfieldia salsa]